MSDTRKYRRQRWGLWHRNPRCHWCGCKLLMTPPKKGPLPDNAATIDHLRPRYHPLRREQANGEQRRVLACRKCNHDRDVIERLVRGGMEYEWKQSGQWQRILALTGCIDAPL